MGTTPAIGHQPALRENSQDGRILQTLVAASPPDQLSFLNVPCPPHSPFAGTHGPQNLRSEVSERQFSPDPIINFGYIAFMAAMGLDLVYKITRSLSYFD